MDQLSVSTFEQLRKQLLTLPRQQWYEHCRKHGFHNISPKLRGVT